MNDKTIISPTGSRARAAWEVRAGVVPGIPIPEHTKRWVISSEDFYAEAEMDEATFKTKFPDGRSTFVQFRDEAYDYAKELMDPRYFNWIEVVWIYY